MSDYFDFTLDIFDEPTQRVSVLKQLKTETFIHDILRKFPDLSDARLEQYGLFLRGHHRPLALKKSLLEQNIQSGDRLTFGWLQGVSTQMPKGKKGALKQGGKLLIAETKQTVSIDWQPFVIGRKTAGGKSNDLIGIDLTGFTNARRVSRNHARIIFVNNKPMLESLETRNPTYLNGLNIEVGKKIGLSHKDVIEISTGRIQLVYLSE